jgi:hypothetical protein
MGPFLAQLEADGQYPNSAEAGYIWRMKWRTPPGIRSLAPPPLIAATLLLTLVHPKVSPAASFHWEFGVGNSWIPDASTLLSQEGLVTDPSDTASLSRSYSLLGSLIIDLTHEKSRIKTPLGIQYRNQSGKSETSQLYYTFQTLWVFFRAEFPRFYVGVQGSPLAYIRSDSTLGFSSPTRIEGVAGAGLEIGGKWPITPEVLFFTSLTGSGFLSNGVWNPKVLYDLTVGLRFRIDGFRKKEAGRRFFGEGESLDDYGGWRYPYGKGI